ncbi:hypothetical protein M9458_040813, partial [Cirrhinus mrigala]
SENGRSVHTDYIPAFGGSRLSKCCHRSEASQHTSSFWSLLTVPAYTRDSISPTHV